MARAITIEATTTVCGNASVENTTNNALRIVEAFKLDVPVYRGAELPLLNRYDFPAEFHGPSGLDSAGLELPSTTLQAEAKHASTRSSIWLTRILARSRW